MKILQQLIEKLTIKGAEIAFDMLLKKVKLALLCVFAR